MRVLDSERTAAHPAKLPKRQQIPGLAHPIGKEVPMSQRPKPTHTQPGGFEDPNQPEDEVVNDSFGTVDIADSTGSDEDKETGDAKTDNLDTHED